MEKEGIKREQKLATALSWRNNITALMSFV